MFNTQDKRGESLIEVLITVAILTGVILGMTQYVLFGKNSMQLSEDKLLATNFAKEGVEAVINIVGTNWLRFPLNQDECWNVSDETVSNASECGGNEILENTSYVLSWSEPKTAGLSANRPYFKWKLIPVTAPFDFSEDTKASAEAFCMKKIDNISGREGLMHQDPKLPAVDCKFYREIKIEYPTNESESMKIVSTVKWFHKSELKELKVSKTLQNNIY